MFLKETAFCEPLVVCEMRVLFAKTVGIFYFKNHMKLGHQQDFQQQLTQSKFSINSNRQRGYDAVELNLGYIMKSY